MDTIEQLAILKKDLFNTRFQIQMNKTNPEKKALLEQQVVIIRKKMMVLMTEIAKSNGQVSFGFADQIDTSKVKDETEVKKGRLK